MSESELVRDLKANRSDLSGFIKGYLADSEKGLYKSHIHGGTGSTVTRAYTDLIDELLRALYKTVSQVRSETAGQGTALIALGGYGRGELNIRSDVDLMLLYKKSITPEIESLVQAILYILWDTGLVVGFSIRSIAESIALAESDLKTRTSMLDTRLILGDEPLYNTFRARARRGLFSKKSLKGFVDEKLEESRSRQAKYGGSVYILEPNVKDGEGGLRDLHTAGWLVKATSTDGSYDPVGRGILGEEEARLIEASVDFLFWVRNDLHFAANRKSDQLTFSDQERIAPALGFHDSGDTLAVESFMQSYYLHASNISRITERMISRCIERPKKKLLFWLSKKLRIDGDFAIKDALLNVTGKQVFTDRPETLIKAFEYSQAFDVEIGRDTRDLMLKAVPAINDSLRGSPLVAESFIKILRTSGLFTTLSRMRSVKFLDTYIPEFGDINCKVQHDMYHVYTVDTHTLFAIREIERLSSEGYRSEFPLLGTLYEEAESPEALMLGVLLHDIGKAIGKGHAEKGARLVPAVCKRLGLPEDISRLVYFLVKNHLLLADTAQYRDLHDEKLIIDFARRVGDVERLNLLYLMTFADVRAVGPEVWTKWKAALFQDLYFKTLSVLERGTFEPEEAGERMEWMKEEVRAALKGVDKSAVEDFLMLLPPGYYLANSPESIAKHFGVIKELRLKPYVIHVRQDRESRSTELTICTHDTPGLFSMITGVLASNSTSILGSRINTLHNGIAFDVLQITNLFGEQITDAEKLKAIEKDLADVLAGTVKVEALLDKRRPSILDKKVSPMVPPRVAVSNEISDAYTVIEIHAQDRVGLLYNISSTLISLGVYIHVAKVSTKGKEASDIFYVRDVFGQKIIEEKKISDIENGLYDVISIEAYEDGHPAARRLS